jgi:chromosome partitioning protein
MLRGIFSMVPVVAFMNLKGGVGKTTLAGNTIRSLADIEKLKILLIDLDSQCNLTQMFCSAEEIDRRSGRSVYQCFESKSFLKEPPGPSDLKVKLYGNRTGSVVDIIYGSFETFRLAVAMPGGLVANAAVQHFYNFMDKAKGEYDLIVLDTNPSATFTTLCALDAANFLVAPITMDTFSIRGIHLLTHVLKGRYQWLGNPKHVRIMPNRIPVSSDAKVLDRLDREEKDLRKKFPHLVDSLMISRIQESKLLSHKASDGGFIADRRVWPMHRQWKARVKADFDAAAKEILLSIREAFGDAAGHKENTLDAMRRQLEENPARLVGRPESGVEDGIRI